MFNFRLRSLRALSGAVGGRIHAFDKFKPETSALLVIDMQNVWVKPGMPAYTPCCEGIVPNINRLAGSMREAGGTCDSWRSRIVQLVSVYGIFRAWICWENAFDVIGRSRGRGSLA